jgi:hypothetical protein
MTWAKNNPFLVALLVVVVLAAGGLGYYLNLVYATYATVSEDYDAQVAKLQKLQNRAPFPNAANNDAFTALLDDYSKGTNALLAELTQTQLPAEDISPQGFQDRLRAVVSEVQALAKARGVTLPEDFYMGFNQYQGTLPNDLAAGPLARQLAAFKGLLDQVIEFRASSIEGISRTPLPEESTQPPAPNPGDNRNRPGNAPKDEAPEIIRKAPFELTFVAEQGRVRQILNAVANSEQFFIIRNLTIVNDQLEGPSRYEESAETGYSFDPSATETPDAPGSLKVIVGREKLTVSALIEMVTFTPSDPTSQATTQP